LQNNFEGRYGLFWLKRAAYLRFSFTGISMMDSQPRLLTLIYWDNSLRAIAILLNPLYAIEAHMSITQVSPTYP
jgi:hypothetical protein